MAEVCTRCGKSVPDDARELTEWEWFGDEGIEAVCGDCVTDEEVELITQDETAFGSAMESAGLTGEGSDPESMTKDEYEMRESLADVFYEHGSNGH